MHHCARLGRCRKKLMASVLKQYVSCSNRQCSSQNQSSTHFGFSTVREDEKAGKVHEVFSSVAANYDKMNDIMSLGIHRLWKDIFIERLRPSGQTHLLDVAGGTGDIAMRFLRHVDHTSRGSAAADPASRELEREAERLGVAPIELEPSAAGGQQPQVVVCDINGRMLEEGRRRARLAGLEHRIHWQEGDAEALPFEDASFDAYTIAFGIRNVTHIDRALSEAYRVLRPGGRFLCLEFSHVPNPVIRWFYDQYSLQVIPPLGAVVASDWNSYQYLVESIRRFPAQEEFKQMVESAGFCLVTVENLTFGVVAIHSGFKLPEVTGSEASDRNSS